MRGAVGRLELAADQTPPRLRSVLATVVSTVAALQLAPFLTATPLQLALHGRLIDDAFFYSILARNYLDLGFLTFDGEMPTNGVQPLWMAILILMKWLLPRADEVAVLCRLSWACYVAFAGLASWLVATGRGWTPYVKVALLAAVVVLNPRFQELSVQGLETPVMLFVLVATLLAAEKALHGSGIGIPFATFLGLLCGLCFFARTDLFWVAPVLSVVVMRRARRPALAAVAFGGLVAGMVIPYLAHNLASHGAFTPISGRVKLFYVSTFYPDLPAYLRSNEWHGMLSAVTVLPGLGWLPEILGLTLAAFVLAGIGYLVIRDLRRSEPVLSAAPRVLAIVVLLHGLFMHFAYRELRPYTAYYFTPALVLIGMVLGEQLASVASATGDVARRRRALVLALLAAALGHSLWVSSKRDPRPSPSWVHRVEIAREARRILGADGEVGAFWPGAIAWFGGLQTVPLDGVIGSDAYLERYLMQGREFDYLNERGIDHVVALLPDGPEMLFADSPPDVPSWSRLGLLRLWERRHDLSVVARSTWLPGEGGWYLLRIDGRRNPA